MHYLRFSEIKFFKELIFFNVYTKVTDTSVENKRKPPRYIDIQTATKHSELITVVIFECFMSVKEMEYKSMDIGVRTPPVSALSHTVSIFSCGDCGVLNR